jgi:TolB-like protein/class 3 adenylate cyclase
MEDRRLAAIVFTDIVGFSSMMASDESTALLMVQRQRDTLQPIIAHHGGQWLKEMGDGSLSSFASASRAVLCAIEIQNQLKLQDQFKVRIGIHLGDVIFAESDVFGDGVNIAARIESLAQPGGIAITGQVFDTLSSNKSIETVYLGEKSLKNIERPIRIYGVSNNALPVGPPFSITATNDTATSSTGFKNLILLKQYWALPGIISAVGLVAWLFFTPNQDSLDSAVQAVAVTTEAVKSSADNTPAPISAPPVEEATNTSTEPAEETATSQPTELAADPEAIFVTPVLESVPAFNTQSQLRPASESTTAIDPSVAGDSTIAAASNSNAARETPSSPKASVEVVTSSPAIAQPIVAKLPDKSIAILPLTNLSADPENAYFAAGVHEEILSQLAKISDLKVISRRSVLRYQDSTESISDIAEELGVATIMEGSVRFSGNRVRITCQLIRASDDTPMWTETYERELEDIFEIQADVALRAADAMQASLQPQEVSRIEQPVTDNTEAYTLYLRSLFRGEQESFRVTSDPDSWISLGIRDLERAIELDPNFALAFAQLAYIQSFNGFNDIFNGRNAITEEKARANANRAIELDPSLSKAYSVLAIRAILNRRWEEFLGYANQIKALPDIETTTYSDLAIGFAVMKRYDESTILIEAAISSDPNSATMRWLALIVAIVSRDYQSVLPLADQYRALGGDENSYHLYRAIAFEFQDQPEEAENALNQIAGELNNQDFGFYPFYTYLNCKRGKQQEMQLFAVQQTLFNLTLANVGCRLAIDDLDSVFEIIKTLQITGIAFPDFGELFDSLRQDERFSELENYMALPVSD